MNTKRIFEVEITRHNVTPAQFLAYVRRIVDKKGGYYIRTDLDLNYFAAGKDLNFDIKHTDDCHAGLHEKSISKPYEMQTYLHYPNGAVYNEICEFEFWDDKTGTGYYYLINVEVIEEETNADTFEEIRENIRKETTRGAWSHGVTEYALELLDDLEQFVNDGYVDITDLYSPHMCTKAVMNGAESWHDYSWGGCSLIYDYQIAERLCSPSELKKTDHGRKQPNAREEWLDVQQRALFQANQRLQTAIANTIAKGV